MDPRTQAHCAVLRLTASLGSRLRPGALEIEFRLIYGRSEDLLTRIHPETVRGRERDGVDPHEDEMARRFNLAMPGSEMRERHRYTTRHTITPKQAIHIIHTINASSTPIPLVRDRPFLLRLLVLCQV